MMSRVWFVAVLLVACESSKPAPAPPPEAHVAAAPIAPVAPVDAAATIDGARPADAVDLGVVGRAGDRDQFGGVRALTVAGEYVYWTAQSGSVDQPVSSVRRVLRSGGTVETLLTSESQHGNDIAILGDAIYITGESSTRARKVTDARAQLFRIARGKLEVAASGPAMTFFSANARVHEGRLYWTATSSVGPGPIMVTPAEGVTRTIVPCPRPAMEECAELLPGGPPLVHDKDLRLATTLAKVPASCPCGSIAARGVGSHVLCVAMAAECPPTSALVPLAGGAPLLAREIGEELQLAGGRYYHLRDGALRRRAALDGADETFAASASMVATDERGVAWIDGERLWIAAH